MSTIASSQLSLTSTVGTSSALSKQSAAANVQSAVSNAAIQLYTAWVAQSIKCVLFLPVSKATSAFPLAANTAQVLTKLTQAPILLMNIDTPANPIPEFDDNGRSDEQLRLGEVPVAGSGTGSLFRAELMRDIDPLAFLLSEEFRTFLGKSRTEFAQSLLYGPALSESAVGLLVAKQVDGCVLVVEEGVSQYSEIQMAKRQLAQTGCNLLGFLYQRSRKAKR